jgi:hypothetical protein
MSFYEKKEGSTPTLQYTLSKLSKCDLLRRDEMENTPQ